jgi:hypothetical protein
MQRISKLPVTLQNRVLDAFEGKERRRSKSKSRWRMVVETMVVDVEPVLLLN